MSAELNKDLIIYFLFVTYKFVFSDVKECAVTALIRKRNWLVVSEKCI